MVLGSAKEMRFNTAELRGIAVRLRTTTVIGLVADVSGGLRLGTRTDDRAQHRRQKYSDQAKRGGASNHDAILRQVHASSQALADSRPSRQRITSDRISAVDGRHRSLCAIDQSGDFSNREVGSPQ